VKQEGNSIRKSSRRLNQQLSKLPQGTAFSFFAHRQFLESALFRRDFSLCSKTAPGRDVQFLAGNLDKFLAAARKPSRDWFAIPPPFICPSVPQKFLDV